METKTPQPTEMKSVRDAMLQRVSVRKYKDIPVTDEQMHFIYDAIRNTPTSYNGQNYCVIDVSAAEQKQRLFEIVGQQQILDCSHFLVFCMDYNKVILGAEAQGLEMPPFYDTVDGVTVAMIDASLAMMSAIVAVESLGLGCCPIGYARTANPQAIAEALKLPQHVMVVCGLSIGVPDEHNDLKPKQGDELLFHKDVYEQNSDKLTADILAYNKTITDYTNTRQGRVSKHDWIGHMLYYYREAMGYHMLEALRERGFDTQK